MEAVKELEQKYRKPAVPAVRSGDTVRVHQLIKEGNKQRVQVFEGVVIRTHRQNELTATVTVRRIASGVGVEKTFLLHSPFVQKVEVMRRSKVRRNFLSYLRGRRGKSARLTEVGFDKAGVNAANEVKADPKPEVSDEAVDADITEIGEQAESIKPDADNEAAMSEEIKQENREAAADDTKNDPDAADDEEQAAKVEPTIERAEQPDEQEPKEGVAE